ncbi:TIGR02266 family protein [Sorangium sp. So ce861]|uniref:TIGR02266 family protein n=1 Tax=Sorangium sp. So ce861 TaxID=3133323 RepID=UPI003F62D204
MTGGRGDSNHPPDTPGGSSATPAQNGAYGDTGHAGEDVECEIPPDSLNRRSSERLDVTWLVDCETDDTFLYASITNISEMGIFVRTTQPLSIGTRLTLRFSPPGSEGSYVLEGTVQWVNEVRPLHDNPNPGMGIRFVDLTPDDRERIVDTIRTIAYIRDAPVRSN